MMRLCFWRYNKRIPISTGLLEDKNGINTASGIGHDIVAILDGDVSNPYLLNDYYQTNLDDYTKGTLDFLCVI
jgi:hypothetical protein